MTMRGEWSLRDEGEDFCPFSLDGVDILKLLQFNRCFIFERHVGTEEVVVGYKESDERGCAIDAIKPVRRFHMVFKGSIESFNELLKWPVRL